MLRRARELRFRSASCSILCLALCAFSCSDNGTNGSSNASSGGTGAWAGSSGSLWLIYEHTQDEAFRTAAEAWTDVLYGQRLRTDTHDIGFAIMSSYGNGYRLTQNADYASVIKDAAQSLNTRFNATVGCTKSW